MVKKMVKHNLAKEEAVHSKEKKCCCLNWSCHGWNIWKIAAVIVVLAFVLVLAGGLFKIYHFRSDFTPANQEQLDTVRATVSADLASKGDDIANYDFNVMPKTRQMRFDEGNERDTIQAFLNNGTTRQMYVVDSGSGEILTHSVTTDYISPCRKDGREGRRLFGSRGPGRDYDKEGFHMMGMMPCRKSI